jgi:hypothetical protein
MKKIILFVLLVVASLSTNILSAQSLNKDSAINSLVVISNNTALNMQKCHSEFKTGAYLIIGSIFLEGAVLINSGNNSSASAQPTTQINILAGISGLIGTILIIDSHKFIGRIGKLQINPNGLIYHLK